LISVVLGSGSMKGREDASAALLNYGFTFYDTKLVVKGGTKLASTPVWKAANSPIDVGIVDDLYVTVSRSQSNDLKTSVELRPRLIAPLARDADVGQLHVLAGSESVATLPVHPLTAVAEGGWWRRLIDTIRLWFN
jgi:D-alanyl-D-alanine carboxypeptidase (penicillin-binding protein 5/6)